MDTTEDVEERDSGFQGNLLVNTRTITQTSAFFRTLREKPRAQREITVSELSELLVLLEAIATSRDLVYDKTVPDKELEKISSAEDDLECEIGNTDLLTGIRPETDAQTLVYCKAGIQQASRGLRERISRLRANQGPVDMLFSDVRPLRREAARAFADELLKPLPGPSEIEEHAAGLIARNPFNGAKCAAGILATAAEDDHLVRKGREVEIRMLCRQAVENRSDDELSHIVPMMMNLFRSNYLNTLGAEHGDAAFFAGPDVASVMNQQIFLLGNYVAGQLSDADLSPDILASRVGDTLKQTDQFPFVGLLVLLSARDREPYSVFEIALGDRDTIRAEFFAGKAGSKRYLHQLTSEQLAAFKDAKLHDVFERLERRVRIYDDVMRENRRFVQPTLSWYKQIQLLINQGLGMTDADFRLPKSDLPNHMDQRVDYAINSVLMPGEYLRYATFTHQIRKRVRRICANRGEQDVVTERVRDVLGCELVPDKEKAGR